MLGNTECQFQLKSQVLFNQESILATLYVFRTIQQTRVDTSFSCGGPTQIRGMVSTVMTTGFKIPLHLKVTGKSANGRLSGRLLRRGHLMGQSQNQLGAEMS